MLEVETLGFEYPNYFVFHNINFIVQPGQLWHLRGANGSGKTTLLKLLAALLFPTEGHIAFHGCAVEHILPTYRQNLCYLGHKSGINPTLTVVENCCANEHWPMKKKAADDILSEFGLQESQQTLCYQLSAGQQRRVALLRFAVTSADIWLLDEPFNALDTLGIALLTQLFNKHLQKGGIIIMSSHQELPAPLRAMQYLL